MKRLSSVLLFISIFLTSLSAESLLKQYEGFWEIMNHNSAVVNKDFIAVGQYKGYKTVSICFIKKVTKAKNHFVITCNPKPSKADKDNAQKLLKEGQPWEEMNEKDIVKTNMKLYPTKDGIKLSEDGREYWKM